MKIDKSLPQDAHRTQSKLYFNLATLPSRDSLSGLAHSYKRSKPTSLLLDIFALPGSQPLVAEGEDLLNGVQVVLLHRRHELHVPLGVLLLDGRQHRLEHLRPEIKLESSA